jgi:hypothetical protein
MTAFWENVWCSYELRWLKWISGQMAVSQRSVYSELKNIEQDIREISHDLNREKSIINNFVAIVDNLFEERRGGRFKLN